MTIYKSFHIFESAHWRYNGGNDKVCRAQRVVYYILVPVLGQWEMKSLLFLFRLNNEIKFMGSKPDRTLFFPLTENIYDFRPPRFNAIYNVFHRRKKKSYTIISRIKLNLFKLCNKCFPTRIFFEIFIRI